MARDGVTGRAIPAITHRMDRGVQRRDELVDRLANHLLEQGLGAASLRVLARAAGTSDRMLLYYFADKDALIAAVLARIAERLTLQLGEIAAPQPMAPQALRAHLAPALLDDRFWPYMRLWLGIAARAAHGEPPYAQVGEQLGRGFLLWTAAQTDSADPMRDAARLLASVEGMVLLKSIGMADVARQAV